MSLSASVGVQIPTNVIEVGNEISQVAVDAIAASSSPSNVNPLMTSSAVSATYAPKASPTFTGVVTIPAGASISGYLTDAPSNGSEYVRKNAAWSVATGGGGATAASQLTNATYATNPTAAPTTAGDVLSFNGTALVWSAGGGGGGLTISTLSNAATSTLNATAPTTGQSLTFDGTDLKWATVGGGGGGVAWGGITGTVTNQTDLVNYISGLGYLTTVPNPTANVRAGGTHTLLSSDWNNCIVFTGGGSLEIPQNYILATPIGTRIYVCNMNSSTNIVGLTDSTETTVIYGTTSGISVGLHILIKSDTNEWFIS